MGDAVIACYHGVMLYEPLVRKRPPAAKFTVQGKKGTCVVFCFVSEDILDLVLKGDPAIIDTMADMAIHEYHATDPPPPNPDVDPFAQVIAQAIAERPWG